MTKHKNMGEQGIRQTIETNLRWNYIHAMEEFHVSSELDYNDWDDWCWLDGQMSEI